MQTFVSNRGNPYEQPTWVDGEKIRKTQNKSRLHSEIHLRNPVKSDGKNEMGDTNVPRQLLTLAYNMTQGPLDVDCQKAQEYIRVPGSPEVHQKNGT
ncbi:hypothetical protein UY3_08197 [Chelonia mydas]|uniref:Uncharacterized protein n=1 Tax=Chelonia mydas TaxID=8469 RepID=M7BG80_CHEMY|nr:hypothetical protein UY3_08197 [Chelonia mydas]